MSPMYTSIKFSNICLPDLPYSEYINKQPPPGIYIKLLNLVTIYKQRDPIVLLGGWLGRTAADVILSVAGVNLGPSSRGKGVCVCVCLKPTEHIFTWWLYPWCLSFTQSSFKTDGIGPHDSHRPSKLWVHNTVCPPDEPSFKAVPLDSFIGAGLSCASYEAFCLSKFEVRVIWSTRRNPSFSPLS